MFCRRKQLTAYRVFELKRLSRYRKIKNMKLRSGDIVRLVVLHNGIYKVVEFYYDYVNLHRVICLYPSYDEPTSFNNKLFLQGLQNYIAALKIQKDNNLSSIEEVLNRFNVKIKRPV